MVCWGLNDHGQSDAPGGDFAAVSAGLHHTCGLRTDGTVVCWGLNKHGQSDAPAGHFTAVSAGSKQSCGIVVDGTITCWGTGARRIVSWAAARTISVGEDHACVLDGETVECWGKNHSGQTDTPEGRFSAVSAGSLNTCARRADDDTIVCWGKLDHGELHQPAVAPPPNVQWHQSPTEE